MMKSFLSEWVLIKWSTMVQRCLLHPAAAAGEETLERQRF